MQNRKKPNRLFRFIGLFIAELPILSFIIANIIFLAGLLAVLTLKQTFEIFVWFYGSCAAILLTLVWVVLPLSDFYKKVKQIWENSK